jgi:hypothetical protein
VLLWLNALLPRADDPVLARWLLLLRASEPAREMRIMDPPRVGLVNDGPAPGDS